MTREDYPTHKADYVRPEQVKATRILISTKVRDSQEARAIAEELDEKILADPEQFKLVAIQNSNDTASQRQGSELDWLSREGLVKPVIDALFAMQEPRAISELVETHFSHYSIRYGERKTSEQTPLRGDQGRARAIAEQDYKQTKRKAYLAAAITESPEWRMDADVLNALAEAMNPPSTARWVPEGQ